MEHHNGLEDPPLGDMLPAAGAFLEEFIAQLDQAAADTSRQPVDLDRFAAPPAEEPARFTGLLDTVRDAAASAVETAGPRYLGYIPGGGVTSSAVGELLSRVLNRYTGIADLAPGLVALEDSVLRWMARLFALPSGANGVLTTGGSQAMLSMMVAARQHHFGAGPFGAGRVYLSDQTHHSVTKAARIAGFPAAAVRLVPTSDGRHVDPGAAGEMIRRDRAAGYRPFLLLGSAGTTNSGSVDRLGELAEVATQEEVWFHVDGCYGGFFQLTTRGESRLAGIERADSISLDPHKSLFLPYGTGALLMRDPSLLDAGFSGRRSDYLQDLADTGLPDYADWGPELTREYRGLRVWLPLHLHGLHAFRQALDTKLDLAHYAYQQLRQHSPLEAIQAPELSTLVFRLPDGDDANRQLLRRVNATGRAFLSSTRLDGKVTLRLCVLSFRTERQHIDDALEAIGAALPSS